MIITNNKKNYKKIKPSLSLKFLSKILIYLLVLLFFFALGIWSERYEWDRKISLIYNDSTSKISSNFYSTFFPSDKIIIDINFQNYLKLAQSRKNYIANWKAPKELRVKVPARISLADKEKILANISIKGTHLDHWEHPEKWSFKVNIRNNEKLFGNTEFAVQHPQTRGYLYEWLFMKFLKYENLIYHKVKFLEVIVNGNNLGLYNYTEAHTKDLLKNNNKTNGPIVFYDKNQWVKETSNMLNLPPEKYQDSFFRADLSLVNKSELINNPELQNLTDQAFNLLESFRNKKLSVSETFDINQMAKLFAIKAIFGAVEFDWKDVKFYYNPSTLKLEPIGREVHVDFNNQNYENKTWWMSLNQNNFAHSIDQKYFLELFYEDKEFVAIYLNELKRISDLSYLDNVLSLNQKELEKEKKLLRRYYPNINVFSEQKMIKQIEFIKKSIKSLEKNNIYSL